ncbi:TonB-dependent receptor [Janthinobacterium fluminis]|uniref:TonB-dependent receptor n=1 Tax=Janthinobacterium fluminis TaxID=2987524 RepID=A0ABT5JX01_9BURK|nr:TonB-dependent receptor [Janthinobacterium fluminis]MDC8757265.1 TonB-dependent receptor [Janthinobacterium fluminis]
MRPSPLSRSRRGLCAGAACGLALLAPAAPAQDAPAQDAPMQRVEITGSSIKRLAAQTALPITTIRAEDFAKQGLTTAQEVLNTIPMNQSSTGASQSVGSGTGGRAVADLRGLGGDKTLVLLNGRRLANHPFNADTVDLNILPVAALERVEVLRDGASAIYGTDAIGGVINFITKRSVQGGAVAAELYAPQRPGGGDEQRFNLSGGFGDLATDGYNLFGVFDVHHQGALPAAARRFSRTGVRPERGVSQTSGTPFPANFFSDNGIAGNPGYLGGCLPPASIPNPDTSRLTCRFDYSSFVDDLPATRQETVLGRASYKLGADHTAALEWLHSRSTNTSAVAPPPLAPPDVQLIMHASSPYYPGGSAGVPAVAGLGGEDLTLSWRPLVTGKRRQFDTSISDRVVLSLDGALHGWDYNSALSHSISRARSTFTGGYVIDARIVEGIGQGILNPFGAQDAAGAAFLADSLLLGKFLDAKMSSSALDFKASRDLTTLPGGPLGFAVGAEWRHDKARYLVDRALASQASSSGYSEALDQFGSRNIGAVFGELNVPVLKGLELNLALRHDRYSDVGGSTNPKVSLRYQPGAQVLLRASYNRGFRAPTLFDLHGPQTSTNTSDTYDDPLLCPGGTAVPGANPNVVCQQQQKVRQGGNPEVRPEKSKTYSIGVAIEPVRDLTLSLDYWNIKLRDQINFLAEQTIFADYAKYRDLFHYSADGRQLDYVLDITQNLGEVHTRGVDVSVNWRLPKNRFGSFTLQADGTYVDKYDYQNERGGPFTANAGIYADATPVFRWRHNILLAWSLGKWNINLGNRYLSGYTDQNAVDAAFKQRVGAYSTWSLSGSYTGIKNVELTAGVKNLTDREPPYTNQQTTFQQGYDPRYTDPLGRTFYVRGKYSF